MVINGICSTNTCARQLSFNFSSMVWGGHGPVAPPLDPPLPLGDLGVTHRFIYGFKVHCRLPSSGN